MSTQRVSEDNLDSWRAFCEARIASGGHQYTSTTGAVETVMLIDDLRDARAEIERMRPVVEAAEKVAVHEDSEPPEHTEPWWEWDSKDFDLRRALDTAVSTYRQHKGEGE